MTRDVVCQIRFSQVSPQGPTILNISFTGLNARAGGYHIHILPIKSTQEPCSDTNIMGHFNPFSVNAASSPAPGNGTVDQYEIGDISGKFGDLTGQNNFQNQYTDGNMPLSGPNSIIGRSLVIHYTNSSRLVPYESEESFKTYLNIINLKWFLPLFTECGVQIYQQKTPHMETG
uniref:Superoxide dismutase copper/zinc binding domain-containing protein n=1 Tax=Sinocyclocheilus anshuiensis TaxID=1608454 RepID=A0A671QDV4_9TELE